MRQEDENRLRREEFTVLRRTLGYIILGKETN
jgi:hypothetical protein